MAASPDDALERYLRYAVFCHPDVLAREAHRKVPTDLWQYDAHGNIATDRNHYLVQKVRRPPQPPPLSDVIMAYLEAWTGPRPFRGPAEFTRLAVEYNNAVKGTAYDPHVPVVASSAAALRVFEVAAEDERAKRARRAREAALAQPWLKVGARAAAP